LMTEPVFSDAISLSTRTPVRANTRGCIVIDFNLEPVRLTS
jgi:hypothetical protein